MNKNSIVKWIFAATILVIVVAFGFMFIVSEGEYAIVTRFGASRAEITNSGVYFKLPWPFEQVNKIDARKQYMATLRLGLLTDTEDTTGTVLEIRPVTVGREDVEAMFRRFLGRQMQVPPMYSAVKVDGKKLYTLARQGQHIERAPRPIEIYRLELVQVQDRDYTFLVDCSKGTYIRTLCKDIGLALGCGGTMAALRRTQAGADSLDDAISLECLLDMAEAGDPVERLLRPVDSLFPHCPKVELSPKQERICRNGGVFSTALPSGDYRLYGGGEFLALARCAGGEMKTIKSFFEVN